MKTKKKTRRLSEQLIGQLLLFMTFLFILLLLVILRLLFDVEKTNQEEVIGNLMESNVQIMDRNLSGIISLAKNLQGVVNEGVYNEAEIQRHIHRLLLDNPILVSACLAYDEQNPPHCTTFSLVAQRMNAIKNTNDDFLYKDWFQIPRLTGRPYWSDPWYDKEGAKTIVCSYSVPLTRKGKAQGIIRVDLPLENLRRIIVNLRVKESGRAFLVSGNGMIMAHPTDSLAMNYTIFDLVNRYPDVQMRTLAKKVVAGEVGFERNRNLGMKGDVWLTFRPLPTNNWSLVAIVPHREVFVHLHYLSLILSLAVLFGFLVLSLMIWVRVQALNKPLTELVDGIKQAGEGDLSPAPPLETESYEIQVISENFEAMKSSLSAHIDNLQALTEERNRISSELEFASNVQRSLIPNGNSIKPGNLDVYGLLEPAGMVGGDLFDYFLIDEGHFLFAIADVVGKGVGAAMTMTMATTLLRSIAQHHKKPQEILSQLNAFFMGHKLESGYMTMALGIIDLASGVCVFSNAGHLPLYVLSQDGQIRKHERTHSTALGFFDNIKIESEELRLDAGDKILLVTDGVTEATNPNDHLFGTQGLEKTLAGLKGASVEKTAKSILETVLDFADPEKGRDDITILAIEYLGGLQKP